MKRQNILFALLLGLSLIGCDDNGERASMALYQRALQSMENKQFSLAKLQADSIKTLYPKAFSVRADALRLLLRIDYAESQLGQSYTDSLLVVNRERVAHLVEELYLDKDVRYQDVGTYYAPGHRSEKNAGRTYIRPQVDERGLVHTTVTITTFMLTINTFYLFAQRSVFIWTLADAIIKRRTSHPTSPKQMLQCIFWP